MSKTSQQDTQPPLCASSLPHNADTCSVGERCIINESCPVSNTRVRRCSVKGADGAVFAGISSDGERHGFGQSNTDFSIAYSHRSRIRYLSKKNSRILTNFPKLKKFAKIRKKFVKCPSGRGLPITTEEYDAFHGFMLIKI